MEVEQEEAHRGWKRRDDMAEDLRSWFCKLSTQERLQVSGLLSVYFWQMAWVRRFSSQQVTASLGFGGKSHPVQGLVCSVTVSRTCEAARQLYGRVPISTSDGVLERSLLHFTLLCCSVLVVEISSSHSRKRIMYHDDEPPILLSLPIPSDRGPAARRRSVPTSDQKGSPCIVLIKL